MSFSFKIMLKNGKTSNAPWLFSFFFFFLLFSGRLKHIQTLSNLVLYMSIKLAFYSQGDLQDLAKWVKKWHK